MSLMYMKFSWRWLKIFRYKVVYVSIIIICIFIVIKCLGKDGLEVRREGVKGRKKKEKERKGKSREIREGRKMKREKLYFVFDRWFKSILVWDFVFWFLFLFIEGKLFLDLEFLYLIIVYYWKMVCVNVLGLRV